MLQVMHKNKILLVNVQVHLLFNFKLLETHLRSFTCLLLNKPFWSQWDNLLGRYSEAPTYIFTGTYRIFKYDGQQNK